MTRAALMVLSSLALIWSCRAAEPPPASSTTMTPSTAATEPARTEPAGAEPATAASCGGAGRECPTQRWMKATLQAYLRTHDYKRLTSSFEALASRAPSDFPRWREMAESGAQGAARADDALVRKSCQDCHDTYRAQFRERYRGLELL